VLIHVIDYCVLLTELLTADRVRIPLGGRSKDDTLRELVDVAVRDRGADVAAAVLSAVRDRERVLSTGIGGGVAIPHGKTALVSQLVMAAGVAPTPIEYGSLDGAPVELFFLLVGPEAAAGAHIKVLSRISKLLRSDAVRDALRHSRSPEEFLGVVRGSEAA
jgi:mannitol/fructose-specific phosphotransferase system IIA component (Ntr-type)